MTTTNDAPAPAPSGSGVRVKDWTKVAKAAGQHGVRYRTNRALEAFLTDIAASLASDATPAPTSGSEDVVLTANDDRLLNKALDASTTHAYDLAKPASEPAGGDVDDAVESAAIRIIRNRASDGPSADRAVAHARQFDTYVWRDAKRDARAALSSSAGPAVEVVENLTRQLWEAKYALAKSQEYAQTWHRICQTIATVLGLPEPEEDFAVRVRDWAAAHPAPATVEMREALPGPAKQLDRIRIGEGEYVRADEAVKTVMELQRQLYDADRRLAALAPATEGRKG